MPKPHFTKFIIVTTVEKLGGYHLRQWIKINITSNRTCQHQIPPNMMPCDWHNTSGLFFTQNYNLNLMRK